MSLTSCAATEASFGFRGGASPRPPKPTWRRRCSGVYTVPFVFTLHRSVSREPRSRRGGPRRPAPQPQDSLKKMNLCNSLSMHLWTQVAQPNSVNKNRSPVSVTVPDPLLVGSRGGRLHGRQARLCLRKSQLLCRGHAHFQQPNRPNVVTGDSGTACFPRATFHKHDCLFGEQGLPTSST